MEDKSSALVSFKRTKGRDAVSVHLNYEQPNSNTSLLTNQQLIEALRYGNTGYGVSIWGIQN